MYIQQKTDWIYFLIIYLLDLFLSSLHSLKDPKKSTKVSGCLFCYYNSLSLLFIQSIKSTIFYSLLIKQK